MKEHLLFQSIVRGQLTVPANATVNVFDEGPAIAERLTRVPEGELVELILRDQPAKSLLLQQLRRNGRTVCRAQVTEPFLRPSDKPGDLDLFLCEVEHPYQAAVIEWKRVIVTPLDEHVQAANKIDALAKGVVQANHLRHCGFFQTYLGIIIAVDAAAQQHYNVLFRGVDSKATHFGDIPTLKRIIEFPGREELHSDIGIIFLELVQPTGRSISEVMSISLCVDRNATPQNQTTEMTNRIGAYLNSIEQD